MGKKKIIGAIERIDIPDLGLFDLDVKIDTGADSNALHCSHIEIEGDTVHFTPLDKKHPSYASKRLSLPLHRIKRVKSSNGIVQERASVKVEVKFFGKKYNSVISLTNRADMKFPMLIGKKFLAKRFLVDVSKEYLAD